VRFCENVNSNIAIVAITSTHNASSIPEIAGASWKSEAANLDYNLLGEILQRAKLNLGQHLADPRQGFYLHLPSDKSGADALRALNRSSLVEIAMAAPLPVPLPVTPPDYQDEQTYEDPSRLGGLGAELVWDSFGITGQGVQVCDLEYDFNDEHCDLPYVEILGFDPVSPYGDDHGTAVLGEMVSIDDGIGTTGIAHGASAVKFAGTWDGTTWDVGNAIYRAISAMPVGSIIIIEQQMVGPNGGSYYVPIEWWEPWYNAVKVAVASGMIVCEAAGNGYQDLDAPEYSKGNGGHYPFLPENDSGAIIVGAGGSYNSCYGSTWLARLSYSNYGSRLDVQGWGECVMTTGYGSAWNEADCDYTATFSGTSSATPIVSGACMLIQSYAIDQLGGPLSPSELRSLLVDTGLPQTNPSSGLIGPFPDAFAAINSYLPLGACCIGTSGACIEIIEPNCNAGGGSWMGPDTICADGHCEPISCEGDVDESGIVDVSDLLAVIDQWGLTKSPADVNDDGIVDVSDLLIVIGNWGPCE
jgi:hypothetical protein